MKAEEEQAVLDARYKSAGEVYQAGKRDGIKEVVEWIKKHELTSPDDNSITRFYPFYQIEDRELDAL